MAEGAGSSSLHWKALYQAALFEIDKSKIRHRIQIARTAILDRIEDLNGSNSPQECGALLDALNVLRDLDRMADGDSKCEQHRG